MFFNKKSFLKSEIAKLSREGLINKAQVEAISDFYQLDESSEFPFLVVFGFIFIGFSFVTLIAYNWQEIPNLLKTLLLLMTLLFTQMGIFYSKNRIIKEGFGILSIFVLLANVALLSQIYHLGDNVPLAFLSVGCVALVLAFAMKSFAIFMLGYLLTGIWYILGFELDYNYNLHSNELFICFIVLGIIIQSGIFFKFALKSSKILAFVNFIFLLLYLTTYASNSTNIDFSYLIWLPLIILSLQIKPYITYAYFTLASMFLAASLLEDTSFIFVPSILFFAFFVCASFVHLYHRRYFLSALILGCLSVNATTASLYYEDAIIVKGLYSALTLLLGIHLIKENDKILGLFVFFLLILIRYVDLLGDYIGASALFLCFGLILLLLSRRKNA